MCKRQVMLQALDTNAYTARRQGDRGDNCCVKQASVLRPGNTSPVCSGTTATIRQRKLKRFPIGIQDKIFCPTSLLRARTWATSSVAPCSHTSMICFRLKLPSLYRSKETSAASLSWLVMAIILRSSSSCLLVIVVTSHLAARMG